jgi:cold-inducible RNA-binding protein
MSGWLSLTPLASREGVYSVLIAAGGSAMPAKLFVGNLSFQATEEDLRELFQQAGTVESVRIVTDQFTGRPRGFGFVEMATKEELAKAIEMLNGRLFRDRNLVVDEARPQPQRTGGGGGGGPRGGGGGGRPGGGGGGGWRR